MSAADHLERHTRAMHAPLPGPGAHRQNYTPAPARRRLRSRRLVLLAALWLGVAALWAWVLLQSWQPAAAGAPAPVARPAGCATQPLAGGVAR